MNIKKLNEELKRIVNEYWSDEGYNKTSSNILLRLKDRDWDEKTLKLASSVRDLDGLLKKLDKAKISYYFYTCLDEDNFEAESLDQLETDISNYYQELYSSSSSNVSEDDIIIDDDSVIVGTASLEVSDDYDEDEDETFKTFADWFGEDLTGQTYEGDIRCTYVSLKSLKGCPKKVTGNFFGSNNKLTSLEGAPEYVGGDFDCHYNKLTSLKGAPEYVGGDFNCNYNRLTSLEGAPKYFGENLNCMGNSLTSLDGIGDVKGEIYSDL